MHDPAVDIGSIAVDIWFFIEENPMLLSKINELKIFFKNMSHLPTFNRYISRELI